MCKWVSILDLTSRFAATTGQSKRRFSAFRFSEQQLATIGTHLSMLRPDLSASQIYSKSYEEQMDERLDALLAFIQMCYLVVSPFLIVLLNTTLNMIFSVRYTKYERIHHH